jgi:hypothetical protein
MASWTEGYAETCVDGLSGMITKQDAARVAESMAYLAILGGIPAASFQNDLLDLLEKFFGSPLRAEAQAIM